MSCRILHCGDLHFQNTKTLPDIIKCTDYLTKIAETENLDLIVVAGDLLGFYESPNGIPAGSPAHKAAIVNPPVNQNGAPAVSHNLRRKTC